jgi:hypothetical protein
MVMFALLSLPETEAGGLTLGLGVCENAEVEIHSIATRINIFFIAL